MSVANQSQDLEELKETITKEVHKAVKIATSDLSVVFYQALSQLNSSSERTDSSTKSWSTAISVPKTKSQNGRQSSHTKLKNSDMKPIEEVTDNLSLTNFRLLMVESSCPTSSASDTSWVSASSGSSMKKTSKSSSSVVQEERSLKRSKVSSFPRGNSSTGLWCYNKKKQKWMLVSKYGKCVCRRCLAPVHQQKSSKVSSSSEEEKQTSVSMFLKEDKATNTVTKCMSRIPVRKFSKEGMNYRFKMVQTSGSTTGQKLFLTPNVNGTAVSVQTELSYCSISTQTKKPGTADRTNICVQTIGNKTPDSKAHRCGCIQTTPRYNPPKNRSIEERPIFFGFNNKGQHRLI